MEFDEARAVKADVTHEGPEGNVSEGPEGDVSESRPTGPLRRGWTTGACATAAAKAAYTALLGGGFPDPVTITLPGGQTPAFALALEALHDGDAPRGGDAPHAAVGIVKDAGDDPDVTHGALIVATVRHGPAGTGITFVAGEGVGTVTLPGLPLAVGQPAINPVPRRMITEALCEVASMLGGTADPSATVSPTAPSPPPDLIVKISVPGGEAIARHTWNPRLGIVGGISILGTTGIVVPYSCSAWIHSIHRGVDVARAVGHRHVAGCTGSTSEATVRRHFGLPDTAMLDMGDFAGGLLKYVRSHPVERLTIGGGFAKLAKLAAGHLDLHSGRSQVDIGWLAERLAECGAPAGLVEQACGSATALGVLHLAGDRGLALASLIANQALLTARGVLGAVPIAIGIVVVDREGGILAEAAPE